MVRRSAGQPVGTCSGLAHANMALRRARARHFPALKSKVSRDLRLQHQPKLVEIIAAIPEPFRPMLLPKLKAKPVRTASGVRVVRMGSPGRLAHRR